MELKLLALLLCLFLNAFFSAAEIAIVSVTRAKVKTLVKAKKLGADALAKLKDNPQRLFSTIQIGINGVSMAASALTAVITLKIFGSYWIALGTAIITFLVIVFGEIIPKNFAYTHSQSIALASAGIVNFLAKVLSPLVFVISLITKGVLRKHGEPRKYPITEDELRTMVAMGVESGEVEKKERELIENVFQLNDITAEEIMTPRVAMFCLSADMKLKDAVKSLVKSRYSRIPLYQKNRDNIVGILFIKDALKALAKGKENIQLKTISIKPHFVPESILLNQLFKQFQEKKVHMAVVVDEFGGVAGVVTLEDLLEELVGEIIDESDITPDLIMRIDKNTILVDGKTEVGAIFNFFNIRLPGKNYETVNKVILKKLKRIPKQGDEVKISDDAMIRIEEATKRNIKKIKISKIIPEQPQSKKV